MKNLVLFSIMLIVFPHLSFSQTQPEAEINLFLDEWHQNAADADMGYFNKIAENGIYIGTDKTELWTKAEFKEWSKEHFESGDTWDFEAKERNVYFSPDSSIAWFDELLDTWMGDCRASGVLQQKNREWQILHYHLAVAVPNEVLREIVKTIEKHEND